jgi:epoxide hydrolase
MSDSMRPYRIEIPEADVEYLHDRLANARWPGELPGVEWARGVLYPQFTTEIDVQRIHFLHVRSGQSGAKPLLITHGFPSSVAGVHVVTDPLTDSPLLQLAWIAEKVDGWTDLQAISGPPR